MEINPGQIVFYEIDMIYGFMELMRVRRGQQIGRLSDVYFMRISVL